MKKLAKSIAILTSSRADFGIYSSLIRRLDANPDIDLTLIAFGMHLEPRFGLTIGEVKNSFSGKIIKVKTMPEDDSPESISTGYGEIIRAFSKVWSKYNFDLVFALGDRFEMSAAVQSTIPFEVNIAHIHGGETTLGAIDNIYRYQISLASKIHFVAAEPFKIKLTEFLGSEKHIYNVGSLSLDLERLELPTWDEVRDQFNIPLRDKYILTTFHPETVESHRNKEYAAIAKEGLKRLTEEYHIIVTLTNADTNGKFFNEAFKKLKGDLSQKVTLVNSFGHKNYLCALKHVSLLLGNTSSGIIEAASFNKFSINIGSRQKGRVKSENTIDVPFDVQKILTAVKSLGEDLFYKGQNVYEGKNTAEKIEEIVVHEEL